jgi:hypothetical protein
MGHGIEHDDYKRDPYANLPPAPSFSLGSSLVADGETLPIAQRDGIFGDGTAKVRSATPATHAALHDHYADQRPGVNGKQSAPRNWYEIDLKTARSGVPTYRESPAFAERCSNSGAGFEPATFGL